MENVPGLCELATSRKWDHMTDKFDADIRANFGLSAFDSDEVASPNISRESDNPGVEALIAAILSNKHTLSAEDLAVFEELLYDPDCDPEQRAEFLQTIWTIVVSIIDHTWDNALFHPRKTAGKTCGSFADSAGKSACGAGHLVSSGDEELLHKHNMAAARPDQEDGP